MSEPNAEIPRLTKFTLCVKRCQEGKTFTCISTINTRIAEDEVKKRSVHIIYTMNTLLANKQFVKRLAAIDEQYGHGSVVVFASKYSGKFAWVSKLETLKGKFMTTSDKFPRIIVQCSNGTRFDDGLDLFTSLDQCHGDKIRTFAYYDELHKYIDHKKRVQLESIHALNSVEGMLAMTATPKPIYMDSGVWSRLRVFDFDRADLTSPNYIGFADHKFINIEKHGDLDEMLDLYIETLAASKKATSQETEFMRYLAYVLSSHNLLYTRARVFAPAMHAQRSHAMVRSLIFKLCPNSVVVVLNGAEKTLQYYNDGDDEPITRAIPCHDDEVCNEVASIIQNDELEGRPLVFTGFLCVSMGQTLTCEKTGSFTSAVLPPQKLSNEDIYQLFGRTCGNMRQWTTYCTTNIYCPDVVMQRCIGGEDMARRLAEENNGEETGLNTLNEIITSSDYASAIFENPTKPKDKKDKSASNRASTDENDFDSEWSEWFKTEAEVNRLWSSRGGKPQMLKSHDGYIVCSTTGAPMPHHISEIDRFRNGKKTTNMPGASKMTTGQVSMRRYVAYENMGDKESARFCLHYIKRK
jgi:hypothetical protein